MALITRSVRQDAIWVRFNAIRNMYDQPSNLSDPTAGMPNDPDVVALQAEYDALVTEYAAIHTANGTRG